MMRQLIFTIILITNTWLVKSQQTMQYNKLTPEEERVIIFKGTERPFTGEYTNHKDTGVYVCKRCETVFSGLRINLIHIVAGPVSTTR